MRRDVHLLPLAHGLGVTLRDFVHLLVLRQLLEQALPQNVVELEAAERLQEQRLHAVRDVVLLEEVLLPDFAVNEVADVQHGVTLGHVEDALARGAEVS